MFNFFKAFLLLWSLINCLSSWGTTAVNDVQVNYLTSFHYSGPEGWPSTGYTYTPPYYNEERDEIIGINGAGDSRRIIWAMKPSNSHYYKVPSSDGLKSYTGLLKHPLEDYLVTVHYKKSSTGYTGNVVTKIATDGSNPVDIVLPQESSEFRVSANSIFDNQQRLYFAEADFNGSARIARFSTDYDKSEFHNFTAGPQGQMPVPNGMFYSGDGWIYGLLAYKRGTSYKDAISIDPNFPVGIIYKIHPDQHNSYQVLHTFLLKHGELPFRSGAVISAYLIENDEFLYGGTSVGICNGILCGSEYTLYDSYGSGKGELRITTPAPHYEGSNPYGSLYRIKKDGSDFALLHTFSGEDGSQPRGPMVITPDGYLYGTTMGGGVHKSELTFSPAKVGDSYPLDERNESPNGTIYRLKLTDIEIKEGVVLNSGFEHVHSFRAGLDENADGKMPTGLMLAGNEKIYGTTRYGGRAYTEASGDSFQFDNKGTVFEIDLQGSILGGNIVVSATPGKIGPGEEAEITWSGGGISNCLASGGSEQDSWQQSEEIEVMGSMKVIPEAGIYYYTINCSDDLKGGRVGAIATLYVDAEPKTKSSTSLDYGNGAGSISLAFIYLLFSLGLIPLFKFRIFRGVYNDD